MAKESQLIVFYWATVTAASATAIIAAGNAIGEVVGFSGPNMTANPIDVTNLTSTAKEKLIGVYDGGQVTLNLNAVVTDTGQTKIRESLAGRHKGACVIRLSSAATTQQIHFDGSISAWNITGSVDNKLAGDVTISITGGVNIAT